MTLHSVQTMTTPVSMPIPLCWVFEQTALKGHGLADLLAIQLPEAVILSCQAQAHDWPAQQPPRLLLLDAARPPEPLALLIPRLRAHLPGTPLVFLGCTHWDDEALADVCLPAGMTPGELANRLLALPDELQAPHNPNTAWALDWSVNAPDSWTLCDSHWPALPQTWPAQGTPMQPTTGTVTPREQQIIALLANGLSARVVAQRLFISEGTVRKHRENLRRKLDLRTTAELAVWAASQGLLTDAAQATEG